MPTPETAEIIDQDDSGSLADFIAAGNAAEAGKPLPEVVAAPPAPSAAGELTKPTDGEGDDAAAAPGRDEKGKFTAKPRSSAYARMSEATAKEAEAKRLQAEATSERETLRAENARLKAQLDAASRPAPKVEPPAATAVTKRAFEIYKAMPDAPQLLAKNPDGSQVYEEYADWAIDMQAFITDQRLAERDEQIEERSRATTWQQSLAAARKADPTIDSRLDPSTPLSGQMRDYVIDPEHNGVKILEYLSANKHIAQRLASLHPLKAAEELAKIDIKVSTVTDAALPAGPAPSPVISKAAPPIKPVVGSHSVSDDADDDPENLPLSKFIERGNKQEFKRIAARH